MTHTSARAEVAASEPAMLRELLTEMGRPTDPREVKAARADRLLMAQLRGRVMRKIVALVPSAFTGDGLAEGLRVARDRVKARGAAVGQAHHG